MPELCALKGLRKPGDRSCSTSGGDRGLVNCWRPDTGDSSSERMTTVASVVVILVVDIFFGVGGEMAGGFGVRGEDVVAADADSHG